MVIFPSYCGSLTADDIASLLRGQEPTGPTGAFGAEGGAGAAILAEGTYWNRCLFWLVVWNMGKSTKKSTISNGKSQLFMQNQPFLMEHNHFLVGKSTISNGKSQFLMGQSTLVVGLEHFLCFHILGIVWNNHPNSLIFFRGVGQPPTSFILGGFENTGGILDGWILNPCFLGWTHLELFHILPENGPRKNRSLSPRMFGNPTIEPNHRVLKVSRNPTIEKSNVIGLPCLRSHPFQLAGMGEQHLI